jgi:hypothetical protein
VQDLSELTDQLDLDAALARTQERHRELLHERAVRRRFVTTGAFAAVIVAAVVLLPQLGSDDRGQAVRFAGPGGSSTAGSAASQDAGEAAGDLSTPHLPRSSVVSPDFDASQEVADDGDVVFVLERKPETLPDVPNTEIGGAVVGSGTNAARPIAVTRVAPVEGQADVVRIDLVCAQTDDEISMVRYRFDGPVLLLEAAVWSGPGVTACAPGEAGPSMDVPLDQAWDPSFRWSVAEL